MPNQPGANAIICSKCNSQIPVGSKFCLECGEKVNESLFCMNCGEKLPPNAKFCLKCGNKING
ncbi:MAG: zinc ribbon domain-containing protein [Desulfitobacterium hafniense]|nr:zinc ribbon domain-containing protein [Desulfitobacterium hafniense]